MAGNYPDTPGPRMAYDRDGSQVLTLKTDTSSPTLLTPTQAALLNNEKNDIFGVSPVGAAWKNIVIFPELRDIAGYLANFQGNTAYANTIGPDKVETSVDSTNGFDGTWVDRGAWVNRTIETDYRTLITAVNWLGIKAIRFGYHGDQSGNFVGMGGIHLYGKSSSLVAAQRVMFWHPTLDQPIDNFPAYFDWGNRPRSSTQIKTVRIKNMSDSLTASSIAVGVEALTDATPAFAPMHTLTYAGTTGPSATIPTLAPGQISGAISVTQALSATAVVGPWAQRLFANAGSWA